MQEANAIYGGPWDSTEPTNWVAYWTNNLGEECSSRIRAAFVDFITLNPFVVVYNWRSRDLEVKAAQDLTDLRKEV